MEPGDPFSCICPNSFSFKKPSSGPAIYYLIENILSLEATQNALEFISGHKFEEETTTPSFFMILWNNSSFKCVGYSDEVVFSGRNMDWDFDNEPM